MSNSFSLTRATSLLKRVYFHRNVFSFNQRFPQGYGPILMTRFEQGLLAYDYFRFVFLLFCQRLQPGSDSCRTIFDAGGFVRAWRYKMANNKL